MRAAQAIFATGKIAITIACIAASHSCLSLSLPANAQSIKGLVEADQQRKEDQDSQFVYSKVKLLDSARTCYYLGNYLNVGPTGVGNLYVCPLMEPYPNRFALFGDRLNAFGHLDGYNESLGGFRDDNREKVALNAFSGGFRGSYSYNTQDEIFSYDFECYYKENDCYYKGRRSSLSYGDNTWYYFPLQGTFEMSERSVKEVRKDFSYKALQLRY